MKTIGAFEAKTHLSELLDLVALGERITITRRGAAVAMLVPLAEDETRTPSPNFQPDPAPRMPASRSRVA